MASKRLTKQLREAFVKAVMNDVPKPDDEQCSKELQEILFKDMPECVQHTLRLYPGYLETSCFTVYGIGYRSSLYLRVKWHTYEEESLSKEALAYLERIKNLIIERDKFEEKLTAAVTGCKTVKGLKDALPELEKYCPDDTPTVKAGLPVVANMMAEAVRRGWPGGKIVNAQVQLAEAA